MSFFYLVIFLKNVSSILAMANEWKRCFKQKIKNKSFYVGCHRLVGSTGYYQGY